MQQDLVEQRRALDALERGALLGPGGALAAHRAQPLPQRQLPVGQVVNPLTRHAPQGDGLFAMELFQLVEDHLQC